MLRPSEVQIQFEFLNCFLTNEASQKRMLDFDVSNMPISGCGLHYWREVFFTVPLSKIVFSQNQCKDYFSKKKKNPTPPPPPHTNIKWTLVATLNVKITLNVKNFTLRVNF